MGSIARTLISVRSFRWRQNTSRIFVLLVSCDTFEQTLSTDVRIVTNPEGQVLESGTPDSASECICMAAEELIKELKTEENYGKKRQEILKCLVHLNISSSPKY